MAHTNSTLNYGLPQWVGTDKPTFLGDLNTAFDDIDAQMKVNADGIVTADDKAENATTLANGAQSDVNALTTRVTTAEGNIENNTTLIGNNATGISNLTSSVETINTALTGKQNNITGAASTVTTNNLTSNRVLVSDSDGKITNSSINETKLGYLSNVTSDVQTQINNKLNQAWTTLLDKHVTNTETSYTVNDVSQYTDLAFTVYRSGLVGNTAFIPAQLFLTANIIHINIGGGSYIVRLINNTTVTLRCTDDFDYDIRLSVR